MLNGQFEKHLHSHIAMGAPNAQEPSTPLLVNLKKMRCELMSTQLYEDVQQWMDEVGQIMEHEKKMGYMDNFLTPHL